MYKRYDLYVYGRPSGNCIYYNSFSSINLLVKFASGFDQQFVELEGIDIVLDKTFPIYEYCEVFKNDCNGI